MNWDQISDHISGTGLLSKQDAFLLLSNIQSVGLHVVTEAHLMEMTTKIDQHPDDYEGACNCDTCRSYD